MTKKTTKRALLLSVLSMLICCSMLVGTTFAWFTDSVTSGINRIVAGNLDVDAYVGDPEAKQSILNEDALFKDVTLWEPGALAYENITVANLGTLALKYELTVAFANENTVNSYGLSDILSVGVVFGKADSITSREAAIETVDQYGRWEDMDDFAFQGTLEAGDLAETLTIVIYWEPSSEDNNYNVNNGRFVSDYAATNENSLHIDLGIAVSATQLDHEADSFGPDYDADLVIPTTVATYDELKEALANGGNVVLTEDIEATEILLINKATTLDGNGKTITSTAGAAST